MRSKNHKSVLMHAGLAASILLLASGATFAQQQVSLAAGPATVAPGGTPVPMWGYSCAGVAGPALTTGSPACSALYAAPNTTTPNTTSTTICSPDLITVPSGQDLQINLTHNL